MDISEIIRQAFDKLDKLQNDNIISGHRSNFISDNFTGNGNSINANESTHKSESDAVNFRIYNGVLNSADFNDNVTVIKIPDEIRKIGRNVFENNTVIREVVLPDNLEIIGEEAFCGCRGLNRIDFPDKLEIIEERSFKRCALRKIVIPDSVKRIYSDAFSYCDFVSEIIIPLHTELFPNCFDECSGDVWVSDNGALIRLNILFHDRRKTDKIIRKMKILRGDISPDTRERSDVEFMMQYYIETGNKKAEDFFLTNLNEFYSDYLLKQYVDPVIEKLAEKNLIPEETTFNILKYNAGLKYVFYPETERMLDKLLKTVNLDDDKWFNKMNQNQPHNEIKLFVFPDKTELQNMSVSEICSILKKYSETDATILEIRPAVSEDKIKKYIDRFRKYNIEPDSDYIEWLKQCDGIDFAESPIIHGVGHGHVYLDRGIPEGYDQIAEDHIMGYGISFEDGKCYQFDEDMDTISPYPFRELLCDLVEECDEEAYEMHCRKLKEENEKPVITISDFRGLKEKIKKISETETCGKCGDDLTWIMYPDGTCVISGTGRMFDYAENSSDKSGIHSPFSDNKNIKRLIAEEGVSGIGAYSFSFCRELSEFTAGSTLTFIGEGAFTGCGLKAVSVQNDNIKLGKNVFYYRNSCSGNPWIERESEKNPLVVLGKNLIDGYRCSGNVTIPESVAFIHGGAFAECTSLLSVLMPASVKETGEYVFAGCVNLTEVTLSSSLRKIEKGMFSDCEKITTVRIPEGVRILGCHAFNNCESLVNLTLPSTLEEIEYQSFEYCTKIVGINIPEGVKSIGSRAFYRCKNLKKVYIPSSVTDIGEYIFAFCSDELVAFVKENSPAHKYVLENNRKYEFF